MQAMVPAFSIFISPIVKPAGLSLFSRLTPIPLPVFDLYLP